MQTGSWCHVIHYLGLIVCGWHHDTGNFLTPSPCHVLLPFSVPPHPHPYLWPGEDGTAKAEVDVHVKDKNRTSTEDWPMLAAGLLSWVNHQLPTISYLLPSVVTLGVVPVIKILTTPWNDLRENTVKEESGGRYGVGDGYPPDSIYYILLVPFDLLL